MRPLPPVLQYLVDACGEGLVPLLFVLARPRQPHFTGSLQACTFNQVVPLFACWPWHLPSKHTVWRAKFSQHWQHLWHWLDGFIAGLEALHHVHPHLQHWHVVIAPHQRLHPWQHPLWWVMHGLRFLLPASRYTVHTETLAWRGKRVEGSQKYRTREERWQRTAGDVHCSEAFQALVQTLPSTVGVVVLDDVSTTTATLTACIQHLQQVQQNALSMQDVCSSIIGLSLVQVPTPCSTSPATLLD